MPIVWESFGATGQDPVAGSEQEQPGAKTDSPSGHRMLWGFMAVFFVVGDLGTTGLGYVIPGVAEFNPSMAAVIDIHGLVGMISLKVAAVFCAVVVYRLLPRPHKGAIPLGMLVVGVGVTIWNLLVITSSVFA